MNKIVRKEQFSEKVFLFEIEAPLIAKSRKAGNFVIVRVDKKGERMPLTIAGADIEKGTITLVLQRSCAPSTLASSLPTSLDLWAIPPRLKTMAPSFVLVVDWALRPCCPSSRR